MKMKKNVIILTPAIARKTLAAWYAKVAADDPREVAQCILEGNLNEFIPPSIKNWKNSEVAETFGNLNLGEPFVCFDYEKTLVLVDQVLVQMDENNMAIVWELGNISPKERARLTTEFDKNQWGFIEKIISEKEQLDCILPSFNEIARSWSTKDKINYCRRRRPN